MNRKNNLQWSLSHCKLSLSDTFELGSFTLRYLCANFGGDDENAPAVIVSELHISYNTYKI